MTRLLPLLATAGAIALGGAFAVPSPVRADPYPPGTYPGGSYRSSCSNIHFKTGDPYMLVATCKPKASDTAAAVSMLNISPCKEGTISNDNGKLKCPFDWNTQNVSDATRNMPAFRSAGVIVMGRDPDLDTTIKWMRFGYTKPAFISQLDKHTLDFSEAAQILKLYLMEKATPQERREVYNAAYRQVYGTSPGIIVVGNTYDAEMKAGKAWYATIVLAERARKNAPKPPAPTNVPPPPPIG